MKQLCELYRSKFGELPSNVVKINSGASSRTYYKMIGPKVVVGTIGTNIAENKAFIYLSKYFEAKNLNVPKIIAVSADSRVYIQSYIGNTSLYDFISDKNTSECDKEAMVLKCISQLPKFQIPDESQLKECPFFPREFMDQRAVMWDLNYFKYCFLKPSGVEFDEDTLENDFQRLASLLATENKDNLILRDFQSRNIILDEELNPYFIDFQGARYGCPLYDLASFAWQSRAGFSKQLRHKICETYKQSYEQLVGETIGDFNDKLNLMVFFRLLQVLGAYGFRGYVQQMVKFKSVIPQTIISLKELISDFNIDSYPALKSALIQIIEKIEREVTDPASSFSVDVMSFSYMKGIPSNSSNGGGFVFDCRGLHNPGRYEEYKHKTGLDQEVIDFLENRGEIQTFLQNCYSLVDATIDTYLKRGFQNLMVCFGCTGGQHRSVYGAEHMAQHISEKYGVTVNLVHREQNIHKKL